MVALYRADEFDTHVASSGEFLVGRTPRNIYVQFHIHLTGRARHFREWSLHIRMYEAWRVSADRL